MPNSKKYRPQLPKLKSTKRFSGDLKSIREELGLSHSEFSALRRALADAESGRHKTPEHHQQDESWLDWALATAKRYGPQIAELLMAAA